MLPARLSGIASFASATSDDGRKPYGEAGAGWDLVGGPTCLGKLVEEGKALLEFKGHGPEWTTLLSSTYHDGAKASGRASSATSLLDAATAKSTRPSSSASSRPPSALSRPASVQLRPVSALEGREKGLGGRQLPQRPWSAAPGHATLAPLHMPHTLSNTPHPLERKFPHMAQADGGVRARPASALGLSHQTLDRREGECARQLMERDGKELERRVLTRCNQPSMSHKAADGGVGALEIGGGVYAIGTLAGHMGWQPMCDTLGELQGSALEDSEWLDTRPSLESLGPPPSLPHDHSPFTGGESASHAAHGNPRERGMRETQAFNLSRRSGYNGGGSNRRGGTGVGSRETSRSRDGPVRAGCSGRKRLDEGVEGDAVTYHAVRMENAVSRWHAPAARQRPASAMC